MQLLHVEQLLLTKYDGSEAKLQLFVCEFLDRARHSNWDMTLCIPQGNVSYHLGHNYGLISMDAIRAHGITYLRQFSLHAQNSEQIFGCLSDSLDANVKNRVSNLSNEYIVNGEYDGLLYFKTITMTAQTDTRATVSAILHQLSTLPALMAKVDNNVQAFNNKVVELRQDLISRGQPPNEATLITNLFAGYRACSDREFVQYINQRQDEYNNGGNITVDDLLHKALNKCTILRNDDDWLHPNEDQQMIIALTAQLQKLKKDSKKKLKKDDKESGEKKKDNKKKGKDTKREKYPEWKKTPPKDGESQKKNHQGQDLLLLRQPQIVDCSQGVRV